MAALRGTLRRPASVLPVDAYLMEDVSAAFDVFSASEIAQAAGVPVRDIESLVASGGIRTIDGRFVEGDDAVAAVRSLSSATTVAGAPSLFHQVAPGRRDAALPVAASLLAHTLIIGSISLLLTADGVRPQPLPVVDTNRLVFLAVPGPGGGGGGGGLRQPAAPAAAESRGAAHSRSPLPTTRSMHGPKTPSPPAPIPVAEPAPEPVAPPPPMARPDPLPAVVAPIATVDADTRDRPALWRLTIRPLPAMAQAPMAALETGPELALVQALAPA